MTRSLSAPQRYKITVIVSNDFECVAVIEWYYSLPDCDGLRRKYGTWAIITCFDTETCESFVLTSSEPWTWSRA